MSVDVQIDMSADTRPILSRPTLSLTIMVRDSAALLGRHIDGVSIATSVECGRQHVNRISTKTKCLWYIGGISGLAMVNPRLAGTPRLKFKNLRSRRKILVT